MPRERPPFERLGVDEHLEQCPAWIHAHDRVEEVDLHAVRRVDAVDRGEAALDQRDGPGTLQRSISGVPSEMQMSTVTTYVTCPSLADGTEPRGRIELVRQAVAPRRRLPPPLRLACTTLRSSARRLNQALASGALPSRAAAAGENLGRMKARWGAAGEDRPYKRAAR